MKLTRTERWILSNQFEILALLDPESKKHYDEASEIVGSGYEMCYSWISPNICSDEDVLSYEDGKEVLDILSMFRNLKHFYGELADKSGIEERHIRFDGFDGNNESKQFGFTYFLCKTQGKFQELYRGDNYNSDSPKLEVYRRMLREWKRSNDQNKLTKEDIQRIAAAR